MATKPPPSTPKPKAAPDDKVDQDMLDRIGSVLGSLGGPKEDEPRVWMPEERKRKSSRPKPGYTIEGETPEAPVWGGEQDPNEIKAWIYNPAMLATIVSYMRARGIEVNTFEDVEKLWIQSVERATNAYMGSGKKLQRSPWDMLDLIAPPSGEKVEAWKGERFNEVTRTTNIQEMGPETARQVLVNALTQELLRAPTQEEIEDFASRAAAIVSANPQMTETTTTKQWDPDLNGPGEGGYKDVAQTSKQIGRSAEEVQAMVQNEAIDRARENPEYGQIQASTNLVNSLIEAIASPV